jgi:CheY-like chemotaxis protein
MWLDRTDRPDIPRLPYRQRLVVWDQTGELMAALASDEEQVELVGTYNLESTMSALADCPAHGVLVNVAAPDQLWPLLEHLRQEVDETPLFGYCLPKRAGVSTISGVLDYLTKPITRADLRKAIGSLTPPPRYVLIVDDDPDFRRLLARMLHTLDPGLVVAESNDSLTALGMMRIRPPDLLFLDITMPNLDGWTLLTAKNEDEALQDIPVTIVSAQDPVDQSPQSGVLVATLGDGIPVNKLAPCALTLAELLLNPEPAPGQAPQSTPGGAPAWADRALPPGPALALPGEPPSRR